jgi:hypothetical protein
MASWSQVATTLSSAYSALFDIYNNTSTDPAYDKLLYRAMAVIEDELDTAVRQGLTESNADYAAVTDGFKAGTAAATQFVADLAKIKSTFSTLATLGGYIDEILKFL